MHDDAEGCTCPDCGADMSPNGDGEMECDGPDCTAYLDRMTFAEDHDQ